MGVYIKGMDMPTSCMLCSFCVPEADEANGEMCMVTGKLMPPCNHERLEDCPLVPVPPHGDLIDRNELYEKTAEWEAQALHMCEVTMNDENPSEWRRWSAVLTERSAFKYDVANAPAIIPAEEGE